MSKAKNKRSRNWILRKLREWHVWLGVVLSAFIVLVCLTGIYMNHKDLFQGNKKHHPTVATQNRHPERQPLLTPQTQLGSIPVGFEQAMALAAGYLGENAILEKVELKNEHGTLVYKIKTDKYAGPDQELIINAYNGAEITLQNRDRYTTVYTDDRGSEAVAYDWGKIIEHLHSGRLFGDTCGRLLIDFTSLVIIVLTISGVYLWWVPIHRKRKAEKSAARDARQPSAGREEFAPAGSQVPHC